MSKTAQEQPIIQKKTRYIDDSYYRESKRDFLEIFGDNTEYVMNRLALVVFKPEAVVGRRIIPGLQLIQDQLFTPCWGRLVKFDRHLCHNLWRYIWGAASVDRIAVSQLLTTATESLVVIFFSSDLNLNEPASCRLSRFKGSAAIEKNTDITLRSLLKPPNRMINFIHVSDDPIDIIRELGVLFDNNQRIRIYEKLVHHYKTDFNNELMQLVDQLNIKYPEIELHPEKALFRTQTAINNLNTSKLKKQKAKDEIKHILNEINTSEKLPWNKFIKLISVLEMELPIWDLILIGSHYIHYDSNG